MFYDITRPKFITKLDYDTPIMSFKPKKIDIIIFYCLGFHFFLDKLFKWFNRLHPKKYKGSNSKILNVKKIKKYVSGFDKLIFKIIIVDILQNLF